MIRRAEALRRVLRLAVGIPASIYALNALGAGSAESISAPVPHSQELISAAAEASKSDPPVRRESLFGDDVPAPRRPAESSMGLRGFVQTEVARTVASPSHWSKLITRAEVSALGAFSPQVKWKLSGRLDYDAVYDVTDFYPAEVRKDQRLNFFARENYLDVAAGDWDFRLGRQQIVWGEIVGLFFADVVSAKDLREFILPEFEILRIPQWAATAAYSKGDYHLDLVWVPVASYDKIGKPGAEFFPGPPPPPPGFATRFEGEVKPARTLANTNYGIRGSMLKSGWDASAFYYRSVDSSPTFFRQIIGGPQPAFVYQPRHERIHQVGATVAKDFRSFVLKTEAVYTKGRQFNVTRLSDEDGVVRQDTFDWVVGLDFPLPKDTRLNVQLFQRVFRNHDPDIIPERYENGFSVLLNHTLVDRLEGQLLFISSLNRSDWLLRPSVTWSFEKNWRLRVGADIFHGPQLAFFGRFNNRDRIYTELRYSF